MCTVSKTPILSQTPYHKRHPPSVPPSPGRTLITMPAPSVKSNGELRSREESNLEPSLYSVPDWCRGCVVVCGVVGWVVVVDCYVEGNKHANPARLEARATWPPLLSSRPARSAHKSTDDTPPHPPTRLSLSPLSLSLTRVVHRQLVAVLSLNVAHLRAVLHADAQRRILRGARAYGWEGRVCEGVE